ncbi:hypothetical protein CO608_06690 [Lysobacteraceae bacterium NML08-0793]|nr:hypothetical protein CO608_06690 [Xanthomonadaceae bacterium NML08-0793]
MKPVSKSIHAEPHFSQRSNWLRAGVLGANDGLISTASLLTGIAAAQPDFNTLLLTGIAALVGGAVSMAAGEYVSVSSQSDIEQVDKAIEARELALNPDAELEELARIYRQRGLDAELAVQVAHALTAHDALDAHLRDEIGLTETASANPLQAALASAAAFVSGALLPLLVVLMVSATWRLPALVFSALSGLALLGFVSARLGGAKPLPAMWRVLLWGALAMGLTAGLGKLLGVAVA